MRIQLVRGLASNMILAALIIIGCGLDPLGWFAGW